MRENGQIFTTDLMIASAIFISILLMGIVYWNTTTNQISFHEEANERDEAIRYAANSLVSTQGDPSNWEYLIEISEINSIGLVSQKNVLDQQKIQKLIDFNITNYEEIKELLGITKYNLQILFTDFNGMVYYEFGLAPGIENEVSVTRRVALLEGKEILIKVKAWK